MSLHILIFFLFNIANIPIHETTSGTAFFINNLGYLLTNAHLVEDDCNLIYIIDNNNNRISMATLENIDHTRDLALLKVDNISRYYVFFRFDSSHFSASPINIDEYIHVYGFPFGNFEGRGGLIKEDNCPRFRNNGFTIGLSNNFGSSGSPIFDTYGLVIGVLYGGASEDGQYEENGELKLSVYAMNINNIIPFIIESEIPIATYSEEDIKNILPNETFFESTKRINRIASEVVVKIVCVK